MIYRDIKWVLALLMCSSLSFAAEFDFDGDGLSDFGVMRPSSGFHYILNSSGENIDSRFSDGIQRHTLSTNVSDIPIVGDFDGDDISDVGVRRPYTFEWVIRHSSTGEVVTNIFGRDALDIPVPADYDGDGITDLAVRRPETGIWYIKNSSGVDLITNHSDGVTRLSFGREFNDIPLVADYDGDGKADPAFRRPSSQIWYILNSSGEDGITENVDGITRRRFGRTSDIPVPADFDGDGKADLALMRSDTNYWYILNSSGVDDISDFSDGITRKIFGKPVGDIPTVADYDGDGRSDIAVRDPSTQFWYALNSSGIDQQTGNSDGITRIRFGLQETDIPLTQQSYLTFYNFDIDGDGVSYREEIVLGTDPQQDETKIDTDGDGVLDQDDAFPEDPNETVDTDNDGVGDNADFYPMDPRCHMQNDGTESECFLTILDNGSNELLVTTTQDKMLMYSSELNSIIPFDLASERFNSLIPMPDTRKLTAFVDVPSQQRLYVALEGGEVGFFNSEFQFNSFNQASENVDFLGFVSEFLLIGSDRYIYIYDENGISTDAVYTGGTVKNYTWDEETSDAFFTYSRYSSDYLFSLSLNTISGVVEATNSRSIAISYSDSTPVFLINGEDNYLLYGSQIYNRSSLEYINGWSDLEIVDAKSTDSNELFSISYVSGRSQMRRYSDNNQLIQESLYSGAPIELAIYENTAFILSKELNGLIIHQVPILDDIDGDGVDNTDDAFPSDVSASLDTDNDGYPDSWNDEYSEEDSTSNLSLDVFPEVAQCWLEGHDDGNGLCDFSATMPVFAPDDIFANESDDLLYLYSAEHKSVFVWSLVEEKYLQPISIGNDDIFNAITPENVTYSEIHNRLYFGYQSGKVTYIDLGTNETEQDFYQSTRPVDDVVAMGEFLMVSSGSRIVIDANGVQTDSDDNSYWSVFRNLKWSDANNRVYYTNGGSGLLWNDIDQITGQVLNYQSTNATRNYDDYSISPDGTKVIFDNGLIYDTDNNLYTNRVSGIDNASWLTSGDVLLMSQTNTSVNLLRIDDSRRNIENAVIDGQFVGAQFVGSQLILITQLGDVLRFNTFIPNNDTDNDGVDNLEDAFPNDIAASVDSDADGYPDSWNNGYSDEDSTTGLSLDTFPEDSACWLTSHGNDDDSCNFSATLPNFTPDEIVSDSVGNIYLYSAENRRIYRWSALTEGFLNPYIVGIDAGFQISVPNSIAWSEEHGRLYLGYHSGRITFLEPEGSATEQTFIQIPSDSLEGLVAGGSYIMAQEDDSYPVRYIIDVNGDITDSSSNYRFSQHFAWNEVNNLIYQFNRSSNPYSVVYYEIDPITGEFDSSGQTVVDYNRSFQGPIRISRSGDKVATGDGAVFNADDLALIGSMEAFDEGLWLLDDEFVGLQQASQTIQLVRRDSENRVIENANFRGQLLGVEFTNEQTVIITQINEELSFTIYTPNNDTDGDGVPNIDDDFPLDVAASLDTDNDGYPDSWNEGYDEADSTTNLAIDAFPMETACWLNSHDDGFGNCDFEATIPVFTPEEIVSDSNGNVYLLSQDNRKVYTWSAATNQYEDHIVVGRNEGFSDLAPNIMVYSPTHNRLYFGYSSGEVTYIDLSGELLEQQFYRSSSAIRNIASAGNFVMVYGGSNDILDINGDVTQTGVGRYSTHYAWNSVSNRLYHFRSGSSPNDLFYLGIDQVTGAATISVESPYHGDYRIQGPILISDDGSRVMLGSGDIYDATDLTWQRSMRSFSDGLWLDNGEVIMLSQADSSVTLDRVDDQNRLIESVSYAGTLLGIEYSNDQIVIITQSGSNLVFSVYVANDDVDGDGVTNLEDAFPTDIAASLDTDNDGFPDSWNEGYTEEDSTTGLTLDIYPQDSACWLESHDNGEGSCDFGATIPEYTPTKVVKDVNGVLYLYSAEQNKVFRWSAALGSYMNPIFVGDESTSTSTALMAYSEAHNRLYFGYSSGQITYVELEGDMSEQNYYQLPLSVGGLVAVGNYILAQDASGAWNTHYVIDSDGNLTDSVDWNYYSPEYAWNPSNGSVYFLPGGSSSSDFHYEEIDQLTGEITARGESPYYSSSYLVNPIRIINSNSHVLFGSGAIFDAVSKERIHVLENPIADAVDFGELLVTTRSTDNSWFVDLHSYENFETINTFERDTAIHSIHLISGTLIIVEQNGNDVQFSSIQLADADGDMIPAWWEDLYGLSDAAPEDAATDLDADGLSNLQEYLLGTRPDNVDTDGDLLSDFDEATVHNTSPILVDTDADGLDDGAEVNDYGTDPLLEDTDLDGFSDGDEVLVYESDPTDTESIPDAITDYSESFENGLPALWQNVDTGNADWQLDNVHATDGSFSLKSGDIDDGQTSSVKISALFSDGTLSFDARVSSESCCDFLRVYLNGELKLTVLNGDWLYHQLVLSDGEHEIEWRYSKDGSASSGDDAAYIDNIKFSR